MSFSFGLKKSISPLLKGFVDIHCHILPGLDDGAKNIEDTVLMLEEYEKMGVKKVIPTPHILKGSYPNTQKSISEAFEKMNFELKKDGILNPITNFSAEHMLDENFENMLQKKELLVLKDNYVLIEMSYFQKPINLEELIFNIGHQGYRPVLAHPERYNFIKNLYEYSELKKRGCFFQLNLLALDKHYGVSVQKKAFDLLKKGWYEFAATDAHHKLHLSKIPKITLSGKNFSRLEKTMNNTIRIFE